MASKANRKEKPGLGEQLAPLIKRDRDGKLFAKAYKYAPRRQVFWLPFMKGSRLEKGGWSGKVTAGCDWVFLQEVSNALHNFTL